MTEIKILVGHNNKHDIEISPVLVDGKTCCPVEENLILAFQGALENARKAIVAGVILGGGSAKQ